MKLIYSINSKPAILKRWGVDNQLIDNLYCYTLSLSLAQEYFDNIIVYTDSIAYSFLKQLKSDKITFRLIEFNLPAEQWTSTKLVIYKLLREENEPFLHIDGDIFLTREIIVEQLKNFQNVIVQGEDADFDIHYKDMLNIFKSISDIQELDYSYNSGVFGVKDMNFLDEYIREWEKYIDIYYSQKNIVLTKFDPSVFLEQYILTTLLHNRVEHETVLGKLNVSHKDEYVDFCNNIGYIHLYGDAKYHFYYQEKIKNRLKTDFPKYLLRLESLINRIFNNVRLVQESEKSYIYTNDKKIRSVLYYSENNDLIKIEIPALSTLRIQSDIKPIEIS